MAAHSICDQTIPPPAAAAFVARVKGRLAVSAGLPAPAHLWVYLRKHFGSPRDGRCEVSTTGFAGHGL